MSSNEFNCFFLVKLKPEFKKKKKHKINMSFFVKILTKIKICDKKAN